MKDKGFSASTDASIYNDCSTLWEVALTHSVEHCNKEANQVAHELPS
jgi:hypothetical protein